MKLKDMIGSMVSKFAALALALTCVGNVWGEGDVYVAKLERTGEEAQNFADLHEALEAGKAAGSVVTLLADVDLTGVAWTPVGSTSSPFCGTFDGDGHTIGNLTFNNATATALDPDGNGDGWHYLGLFGYAENAAFADIVLTNVNISASVNRGDYGSLVGYEKNSAVSNVDVDDVSIFGEAHIGAVIGYAAGGSVTGCDVTGLVILTESLWDESGFDIGGIVGKVDLAQLVLNNCTVSGDSGSFVKSEWGAGGLLGYTGQGMSGSVSGCSVSGLTIEATSWGGAGGLMGFAKGGDTITGCTVSNVTVIRTDSSTPTTNLRTSGLIVGCPLNTTSSKPLTMTNCTMTDSIVYRAAISGEAGYSFDLCGDDGYSKEGGQTGNPATTSESGNTVTFTSVAAIGTTFYATFADAIAAVPADGTATTITMIDDYEFEGNTGVTIAANKNVVLDLNGHLIKQTLTAAAASTLITNSGKLTIRDSSADGSGKLLAYGEGKGSSSFSYGNYTIQNQGDLTINSGTVECEMGAGACYAINNQSGVSDAIVTVNGGMVKSDRVAVRMFCNSTTYKNTLNQNGGEIYGVGSTGLWLQLIATGCTKASLNVTGGTMKTDRSNGYAFYDTSEGGNVYGNVNYDIDGGEFTGYVYTYGAAIDVSGGTFNSKVYDNGGDLTISGGTFNGGISVSGGGSASATGGSFKTAIIDEYCANGYIQVFNSETEYYIVKPGTYVAQIMGKEYAKLSAPISEASDNVGIDLQSFWGAGSMADSDGNACPRYVPITDDTTYCYTKNGTTYGVSAKYSYDTYLAPGKSYYSYQTSYLYEETGAAVAYAKYDSLASAIAAVLTTGKETTIMMIADEAVEAGVTIAAGKNIVLELNGKTISGNTDSTHTYALITNRGTLTIQDNTDTNKDGTGTGLITTYITNPDTGDVPGYASNTITNHGKLTVKSGKIVNNGSGYACYAIDNLTNGTLYSPVLNIEGGRMVQMNAYTYAVRMFNNSITNPNTVNVSGGVITGGYGLWVQTPNNKANMAELTISGGTIEARDGAALYVGGTKADNSNISIEITDGTIGGTGVIIQGPLSGTYGNVEISGGNIVNVQCGANVENFITGGLFKENISETYCAEGYRCASNTDESTSADYPYTVALISYVAQIGDDMYETFAEAIAAADATLAETGVDPVITVIDATAEQGNPNWKIDGGTLVRKVFVAQIGETKYESLADAIAAVQTGDTIVMIADVTIEGNAGVTIPADKALVLDLNGKTITLQVANAGAQAYLIQNNGTLTVTDSGVGGRLYANGEGKGGNNAKCAIQNCGHLTVNGGTIAAKSTNAAGAAYGAANAIHCPAPDADVTIAINGGTLIAEGGSTTANLVTSSAVYIRWSKDTNGLAFTMTDGTLIGSGNEVCSAIDVYLSNKAAIPLTINVSGGNLNGTYAALRTRGGPSTDYENVVTTITGGTFTGFYEDQQSTEWSLDVRVGALSVIGGTFNYGAYLGSHEIAISGGSFSEDVFLYREGGTADAEISGGVFGRNIVVDGTVENVTINGSKNLYAAGKFVSGGYFAIAVPASLCADNYTCTTKPISNGLYQVVPEATVTFALGEGAPEKAAAPASFVYPSGDLADIALASPTYTSDSKTFAGWKESGGSDDVFAVLPAGTTGDVAFIATWSAVKKVQVNTAESGDAVLKDINVTSKWIKDNIDGVTTDEQAVATDSETIKTELEKKDANGLAKWENYVIGQDPTTAVAVGAEQGETTVMPVSNTLAAQPVDTGFTVEYSLKQVDTNGTVVATVETKQTTDFDIDLSTVKSNAYYTMTATIKTAGENGTTVSTVTSTNVIGVLAVTNAPATSIVAVPWKGTGGENISVSNLVRTATLTPGDTLKAYDSTSGKYRVWQLSADKTWVPDTVVGGAESKDADTCTVSRGEGVWLTRQDTSQPIYLVGDATSAETVQETPLEKAKSETKPTWNIVASPSVEPADAVELLDKNNNQADIIVIPTVGAPKTYYYNTDENAWGYDTAEPVMENGVKVGVRMVFTKVGDTKVPAGTGFWYLNTSTNDNAKITW